MDMIEAAEAMSNVVGDPTRFFAHASVSTSKTVKHRCRRPRHEHHDLFMRMAHRRLVRFRPEQFHREIPRLEFDWFCGRQDFARK